MSRFLETSQFLTQLNTLWDAHAVHIAKANVNLNVMLNTASKIPSSYISTLKKLADTQDSLTKSSNKLSEGTEKAYERQRLAELKLQQAREKAFDNFEKQLKKQADAIDKQTAKQLNSNETKLKSEQKLNQAREEALKKHNALIKASTDLEERKQAVLNKAYNSTKEIDKITAKQVELNNRIKESSEAVMKLDTALHKMGSSSKLPGADVRNNVSKVNAKQAAEAAKAQADAARQTNLQNIALQKQALIAARLSEPYNKLKTAHTEAERTLRNLITSETASNREIRTAQKEFDNLSKKVQKADNAVGKLSNHQQSLGKLSSGIGDLMGAFGISTGLYLGATIVKDIFETTKELQSLDLALKMVSGSQAEFASNQSFVSAVAEKWGIEIKGLTQQYTQFYTAAKGIIATEKIKTVFESIAKSGALMGLSVEKQNAAFYAFEQMMSKGVVASEELKKQLGNAMPGAMKAAGMAYMELHPKIKSIQEAEAALMSEMKKGAIDSATYVPLIAKNFEKLYGIEQVNKVNTLQSSQERLANTWTELVRSMNTSETGGLTKFISFAMSSVTNLMNLLVRANSSWDDLYKKAAGQGEASGTTIGTDRFNQGGGTESGANAAITVANKRLAQLQAEYIKNQKEGNALTDKIKERSTIVDIADLAFQIDGDQERLVKLKENKERLLREIAEQGAILKTVKTLKNDIGKVAPPTTASKSATDKEEKAREKAAKAAAKINEKLVKDDYAAQLSMLENEKFILEQRMLLKDNNFSENIRLAAEIGVKEQEIAKFVYDEEIRLAEGSNSKRIIADNKYYKEKIRLAKEYLEKINKVEYKPQYKDTGKVADEEKYGSGVFETDEGAIKNMTDAWQKQQDEKDKIAKQEKERLLAMRDVLNDVFKEFGKATGFEKSMDMFGKVGKNGKTFWENLTGGKEGEIDLKEGLTAGLTITQDIGNKIANDSEARYDRQREMLDVQKEEALKNAGDSATAKAKIEEEYEKKSKEINRKQAITKKKQTLFNIAMDTAQALMALWVNPGFPAAIPMSIAVGALGAAQFAMAAAAPIPSYYVGTDNASEGFANTDERGAELHLDKNNKIKDFGSNKGPRIKYLSEGDKIIPATKTANLLSGNDFSSLDEILSLNNILYHDNKNNQLDTSGIISSIDSLTQTIINKETSEESYDVRGWTKYTKRNGQRIEEKNNRIRFKKSIL